MSDIVERLRNVAAAYPEEFFPPFTQEELDEHSVIISRASGRMGRFLSKHMTEAAAEIERLRADWRESERLASKYAAESAILEARLAEAVEVMREIDRLSLVITSSVRFADRPHLDAVWEVIKSARAIAKLEGRS